MADSRKPGEGSPLRVAPEFAGNGLAAALGKSSATTTTPAGAEAQREWTVFGVDTVAQMAAENAARAAGQPLGQWLSELIAEAAAKK